MSLHSQWGWLHRVRRLISTLPPRLAPLASASLYPASTVAQEAVQHVGNRPGCPCHPGLPHLWQDLDLVFPSKLGTPLDGGNVLSRVLHPLLRQAGLPIIRFHDLRHTAASLALAQGRNIKEVSELLGHADVAVTLSLYAHVSPDMQGQLADAMDAALRG